MNKRTFLAALGLACAGGAWAQAAAPVTAHVPWARASVQGQRASGMFVTLVAQEPLTLVGVASPVAGVAELHEMRVEGDVMRMRAIDALPLAPGQPVQLKPGGYHVMLQELKAPLQPGTTVPVTLTFRNARGERRDLALQVPVSVAPPREAGAADSQRHKH